MFNWTPGMTLEYIEREAIQQALKFHHGNKTVTARSLGCAINTINSKLDKYAEEEANAKRHSDAEQNRRDDFNQRQRFGGNPGAQPTEGLSQKPATYADGTVAGDGLESDARLVSESALPVQERPKVQEVLPKQAAKGGKLK